MSDLDTPTGPVIGRRIKLARLEREWSQTELARRAGIPVTYVNKVEHGRIGAPSGDYLDKLARVLGRTTDDLIRGQQSPPTDDEDAQFRRLIERRLGPVDARYGEKLLDLLRGAPSAVDRNTILNVVEVLTRRDPPPTDR